MTTGHGMRERKPSRSQKYPHYVHLPKGCKSPTDSIYREYDIVSQGRVLNRFADGMSTVRSSEPFTLRVMMPNGKVKEIASKNEKDRGKVERYAELG